MKYHNYIIKPYIDESLKDFGHIYYIYDLNGNEVGVGGLLEETKHIIDTGYNFDNSLNTKIKPYNETKKGKEK